MYGDENTTILQVHIQRFAYIDILYSIYYLTNQNNNSDYQKNSTVIIYVEEYEVLVECLENQYEVLCQEIQYGFGNILFPLNNDEKIYAEELKKFSFDCEGKLLKIIMYFAGLSKLYLRKIKPFDKIKNLDVWDVFNNYGCRESCKIAALCDGWHQSRNYCTFCKNKCENYKEEICSKLRKFLDALLVSSENW